MEWSDDISKPQVNEENNSFLFTYKTNNLSNYGLIICPMSTIQMAVANRAGLQRAG